VNSRAAPKNTAQHTLGIGSELFGFHFEICLQTTLDTPAPRHHGAVEGFFSAPQERADYTSFEGGNKSRVSAEGYYTFVVRICPRSTTESAGAERCRRQRKALTSGQRINQFGVDGQTVMKLDAAVSEQTATGRSALPSLLVRTP
jgi:hypothetical protein